MTDSDRSAIARCARVDAEFHRLMYEALGIPVRTAGGFWWSTQAASPMLVRAGTLATETETETEAETETETGTETETETETVPPVPELRDCFGRLALPAPEWIAEAEDPWLVRDPGPLNVADTSGLTIRRAEDPGAVLEFERAVIAAVGREPPGHVDGAIHPAVATARLRQLHLLTGSIEGCAVGTALAAVTPWGLSIGAVATRAEFRGRGIGRAMASAAISVAPELPATLLASELGYPVYKRLGFREVGRGRHWRRRAADDRT